MCPGARDITAVWERIELPYERIALRTPFGRFLSCVRTDLGPRMTLTDDLGPREAFEEILWPDGGVSFRTCELTFLSVAGPLHGSEPELVCSETESGGTARFRYVDPPADLLDRAQEIAEGQPQVPDMPRQFAHSSEAARDGGTGQG
jgi:hypothetical protein